MGKYKEKSNSLVYTDTIKVSETEKIRVKIRLNDECHNGHQDFAITGTTFEFYHGRWKDTGGGAIGDRIVRIKPEYAIFERLHLCDFVGNPMYPTANGLYHVKNGMSKEEFQTYYRIPNKRTVNRLYKCTEEIEFYMVLKNDGVLEAWKNEANTAIAILENLTQTEFINDSKRSQMPEYSIEEINEYEKKIASGYYTNKEVTKRKKQETKNKWTKKLNSLKIEKTKKIENAKKAYLQETYVLRVLKKFVFSCDFDNYIIYDDNRLCFNWRSYDKKIDNDLFEKIKNYIDNDSTKKFELSVIIKDN